MQSFREVYCARRRCDRREFERRIFWRTLPWHARLLAPLFLLGSRDHFLPDRGLIASAAEAKSMAAIRSQLRDFYWQSNGSSWWHRAARVRISAHRFEQLALRYLPELPPDQEELVVADAMIPDAGTAPTKLDEESRQRELSDRRRELEHWEAALRNRELDLRAKAHELTQRETRADRERVALRERERALAEGFAQLERERHELALSANRLLRA